MHQEVVTIWCFFHPTFPFAQDYGTVRFLQKPRIFLAPLSCQKPICFCPSFPWILCLLSVVLRQHCKQHAVQWSLGSCSCGSFWLSGEKTFVKTNSKNDLQRASSCVGFFTWKRQSRLQIFVKRAKAPDWPQTCFPTIPISLSLRNAWSHKVLRPSHTWTHRIQARSTYKTPPAFTASVLWFPLLIAGNDPHHGIVPALPEPLLFRAGCTMTKTPSPTEQALFSASLLLLQAAQKS